MARIEIHIGRTYQYLYNFLLVDVITVITNQKTIQFQNKDSEDSSESARQSLLPTTTADLDKSFDKSGISNTNDVSSNC